MSARRPGARRRAAQTRRPDSAARMWGTGRGQTVVGAAYLAAMVAVAAVAAWPVYAQPVFLVVAGAAAVAGAGIAVLSQLLGWRAWLTVLVAAAAVLAVGVLLAVPERPVTLAALPGTAADVLTGTVTGWKDLVTVELPVGGYRNLLVPALVVFLAGTLAGLRLAWARTSVATLAAPVTIAMVSFGLLFGSTQTSPPLMVGSVVVPAPVEMAIGLGALVLSVGWLAWLAAAERHRALRRAADSSGVRVGHGRTGSDTRRGLLAGGMVLVAVALAALVGPALAADRTRDVLRAATGPALDIRQAVSPLSLYRDAFTDDRYADVLFTVTGEAALPERVRLATLTSYDGEIFRPLDPASSIDDAQYIRVPSTLDAGEGAPMTAEIAVDALRGIWLPTFGRVQRVTFQGADAAASADAFYYSRTHQSGVETAGGGLASGDRYTVTAVVAEQPSLASLTAPGVQAAVEPPESLVAWVDRQEVGTDGAALEELVSRLRERGYLSHALSISETAPPSWVTDLAGYAFQPSAAGHSLARVDALFTQLLDRETDAGGDPDASLVAAVGDEEQFATAAALVAQHLGFDARVVLGTRLAVDDPDLPACDAGVCRAADLAAWVEVQSSSGDWVTVDATPQHTEGMNSEVRRQRDPENPTDVRPETAQEVIPPDPVQQDSSERDEGDDASGIDWASVWQIARLVGMGLLVLLAAFGPFLVIVAAKASRRRARRRAPDAAARVVGGWDEYVDAAVDSGRPAPGIRTRIEVVDAYGGGEAVPLAVVADRAVFSDARVEDADAEAFWRIVDERRRAFRSGRSVWGRIAAAVSLKSFTRALSAGGRAKPSRARERRSRSGGEST